MASKERQGFGRPGSNDWSHRIFPICCMRGGISWKRALEAVKTNGWTYLEVSSWLSLSGSLTPVFMRHVFHKGLWMILSRSNDVSERLYLEAFRITFNIWYWVTYLMVWQRYQASKPFESSYISKYSPSLFRACLGYVEGRQYVQVTKAMLMFCQRLIKAS